MTGWGGSWEAGAFPDGFVWGSATSAYQIEGSVDVAGRGRSIWDEFCTKPGAVLDGSSGDVACDHLNRMPSDVALMARLGFKAYRFSVAWPRIQPSGSGPAMSAGVSFYDRLVDELLGAGIEPVMTLYHWDLPQALEGLGGWTNRATAERFGEYAVEAYGPLSDRVSIVSTLNEPWCSAFLGYASGDHAPGRRNPEDAIVAAHHLLIAHGLGVQAIRSVRADANAGIVLNTTVVSVPGTPMSWNAKERDALRRVDGIRNRWWLDALFNGTYPVDVMADLDRIVPGFQERLVRDGDLETIRTPIDHIGVNFYNREVIELRTPEEVAAADRPSPYVGCDDVRPAEQTGPLTDIGWPVDATGLRDLLVGMHRSYPNLPPVYVTENGAAYDDPPLDGEVADVRRVSYLDAHIRAVLAAIGDGVDVRGYFGWSFLDNFEWAWGYTMRFGLVHVDYETQVRTPKWSARWLGAVARHNALPPTVPPVDASILAAFETKPPGSRG